MIEFTFTQRALAVYRQREAEVWQQVRTIAKKVATDDFRTVVTHEDMEEAWSQSQSIQSTTERSPRDTV